MRAVTVIGSRVLVAGAVALSGPAAAASAAAGDDENLTFTYTIECPVQPTADVSKLDSVDVVLEDTNAARRAYGLKEVTGSVLLSAVAQSWAECLAAMDAPGTGGSWPDRGFYHNVTPDAWTGFAGDIPSGFYWAAENIAYTSYLSTDNYWVESWMGSEGHQANILNENATTMGFGAVSASSGRSYAVQIFGAYGMGLDDIVLDGSGEFLELNLVEGEMRPVGTQTLRIAGLVPGDPYRVGATTPNADGLGTTVYEVAYADSAGQVAVNDVVAASGYGRVVVWPLTHEILNAAVIPIRIGAHAVGSEPGTRQRFGDVDMSNDFYHEINWMGASGISRGWDQGTSLPLYGPKLGTQRDAMAAFMFRLAQLFDPAVKGYEAPRVSPFKDVPTTHTFYREIAWMYESGISTGWGSGANRTYAPDQVTKRDAMAAFMFRLADKYIQSSLSETYTPPSFGPVSDISPYKDPFFREMMWMFEAGISTGWPQSDGTTKYGPYLPTLRDAMAAFMHRLSSV